MYIHNIYSSHVTADGEQRTYQKRLLRVARRQGGRILNRTIANVTKWEAEKLSLLMDALAAKRGAKEFSTSEQADQSLFCFLLSMGVEPWRLMQTDATRHSGKKKRRLGI